jgi:hypothetical protein
MNALSQLCTRNLIQQVSGGGLGRRQVLLAIRCCYSGGRRRACSAATVLSTAPQSDALAWRRLLDDWRRWRQHRIHRRYQRGHRHRRQDDLRFRANAGRDREGYSEVSDARQCLRHIALRLTVRPRVVARTLSLPRRRLIPALLRPTPVRIGSLFGESFLQERGQGGQ